jgi:aminocarboxymuconate-semialdehyde decarboxylase
MLVSLASLTVEVRTDVHNHAIPDRALNLLGGDPVYGVTVEGRRLKGSIHGDFLLAESFTDPAAKVAELESKGLEGAVVSVAPPLFYYDLDLTPALAMARAVNDGLAEFCTETPDRLRWLASVPLQEPAAAAGELERAAGQGCVGVEVATGLADGRRIDALEFEPFWTHAERLGLPVTLHPAYVERHPGLQDFYFENVLGFLFETSIAIERLISAGVLDRHPELQIVLVHGGGYFPYQGGRLRHARTVRKELADSPEDPWAYLDRIWFDIVTHDAAALRYLVERVGAERVVVGTDLPFDMALPEPMRLLADAVDADTAARIAEANPAALYPAR